MSQHGQNQNQQYPLSIKMASFTKNSTTIPFLGVDLFAVC